jgi:mannose-6-phosphate isomerase-like protein (cupin superfamily)
MMISSYNEVGPTGHSVKMTKVNLFESDRMFVDYYFLEPGQEQKAHTHADNDKLYFVLEGNGMFLLGDEEHELGSGQGCVAPAGVLHGVRNHTESRLVLLVSMAPHPSRQN